MNTLESEILKQTSLFSGINSPEFEHITKCMQPDIQSFRKGESIPLYTNGVIKTGVLIDGKVSGYCESAAGDKMLLATVESGDLLGILFSFTGVWMSHIIITADTNCSIAFIKPCFIGNDSCEDCCNSHQIIINNLLRIIMQKTLYFNRRTIFLTMKNIRQKICGLLYEEFCQQGNYTITLPMKREVLAEYLNVSRPSLSRELGQLKKEGILDFYKNVFRILDSQRIEQYAFGLKSEISIEQ